MFHVKHAGLFHAHYPGVAGWSRDSGVHFELLRIACLYGRGRQCRVPSEGSWVSPPGPSPDAATDDAASRCRPHHRVAPPPAAVAGPAAARVAPAAAIPAAAIPGAAIPGAAISGAAIPGAAIPVDSRTRRQPPTQLSAHAASRVRSLSGSRRGRFSGIRGNRRTP